MFFVNGDQRKERLAICKACPVYNAVTGSCGTPLHRIVNPFQAPVTIEGRTFKPCGCFISAKATLKISQCPAGKWPNLISDETRKRIKALLDNYELNKRITVEERKQLTELLKTIDPYYKPTNCAECVRAELKTFIEAFNFGEYVDAIVDEIINTAPEATALDVTAESPVDLPPTISKFQQKPKKTRTRKKKD